MDGTKSLDTVYDIAFCKYITREIGYKQTIKNVT